MYEGYLLSLQLQPEAARLKLLAGINEARACRDVSLLIGYCVLASLEGRSGNLPEAFAQLAEAEASGDEVRLQRAQQAVRNARYYDLARQFAKVVAEYSEHQRPADRIYICTGGGPGIMEAANRGAHEAGALNVGLNIALPHEQSGNRFISPSLSFKFHYFALRKMHFMMRAKALVAFPGGFGTLDELFEVITLVQCKKAKPVPIVLFGSHYWKRLLNLEVLVEEGTISPEDLSLFKLVDDPQSAWDHIVRFYDLRT